MAAFPRNDASRRKNEFLSLGPDRAALTSIGTVYLYRLTPADLDACTRSPAPRFPGERIRALLARIASASVSDKGVGAAGPLDERQLASLGDDEVERLAEAYLESPGLHPLRHEGEHATPPLRRQPGEPATVFLDRLIRRQPSPPETMIADPVPAAAISATLAAPEQSGMREEDSQETRMREESPRARTRWSWVTGALLFLAASLALVALLQSQFTLQTLRRDQQDLVAQLGQIREANASLGAQLTRLETENGDLRRQVAAMDATVRAQAAPPAAKVTQASSAASAFSKARESKTKTAAAKYGTTKKRSSRADRMREEMRYPRYPIR